jgi:hypothetical protein
MAVSAATIACMIGTGWTQAPTESRLGEQVWAVKSGMPLRRGDIEAIDGGGYQEHVWKLLISDGLSAGRYVMKTQSSEGNWRWVGVDERRTPWFDLTLSGSRSSGFRVSAGIRTAGVAFGKRRTSADIPWVKGRTIMRMDSTPQVETGEVADSDLDNVSGGILGCLVHGVESVLPALPSTVVTGGVSVEAGPVAVQGGFSSMTGI